MTIIKVTTVFGRWDEAAEALERVGLTLTIENTIVVKHESILAVLHALKELLYLTAAGVIAGFSVDAQDIKATS